MTFWIVAGFLALVVGLVILDLGVLTRRPRVVSPTEGALSVQLWVVGAVGVGMLLFKAYAEGWIPATDPLRAAGQPMDALLQYLTAYVIEVSLSLDNIVVLAMLFAHFKVPPQDRARALFWVLLASLLARGGMVAAGSMVLRMDWTRWVFAGLLAVAAARAFVLPDRPADVESRPFVRAARRSFGRRHGIWAVVVVAAMADLSFAVDSIPAVFSVTRDPLVAFTSNVMAVLALRSLYFSLQHVISRIRYLKLGLVAMLLGLAVKTAFFSDMRLPTEITISAVLGMLGLSVAASIPHMRRQAALDAATPAPIEDVAEAIAATRRNLRKLAVFIAGTVIILVGILIAPLPGPGPTVLIPIAIAILATEFVWAKRLLGTLKDLQERADSFGRNSSLWVVPAVVVGFWAGLAGIGFAVHRIWPGVSVWTVLFLGGGAFVPVSIWAYRSLRRGREARSSGKANNHPSGAEPGPQGARR